MSVIDDLQQNIDDTNSNLQDVADNLDQFSSDTQDYQNNNDQTISDLQQTAGQLQFPPNEDTTSIIYGLFITGQITLSSGTATLSNLSIGATSTVMFSIATSSGVNGSTFSAFPVKVNPYYITVTVSAGQAVFQSSFGSDASTLNYFIKP